MVAMAVAVLAIVGSGVAWAALTSSGRTTPPPAIADEAVDTAVPGRPVDVGHLGNPSDQASLARLLPPDLADGCEPVNVTTPQLAAARCTTSDGYVLLYETYADRDTLNFAWRHELYEQDLTMDSGDCETGDPGEDGWYYEDSTGEADEGRDACFLDPSGPVLLWTDYGTVVRAWMHGTEASSIQSVYARWLDGTFDPRR
jgi:hypothetical protein